MLKSTLNESYKPVVIHDACGRIGGMVNRLDLIEPGVVPISECLIVSGMLSRHNTIERFQGQAVYLWIDLDNTSFN